MKNIILSADSEYMVYSVPDEVADEPEKYIDDFYNWMKISPNAAHLRKNNGEYEYYCFTERDFIEYLNKWVFPEEPSVLVANIGWIQNKKQIPEKYRKCKEYNF